MLIIGRNYLQTRKGAIMNAPISLVFWFVSAVMASDLEWQLLAVAA